MAEGISSTHSEEIVACATNGSSNNTLLTRKRKSSRSPQQRSVDDRISFDLLPTKDIISHKKKSRRRSAPSLGKEKSIDQEDSRSGGTRQSTRAKAPRVTYEEEFNPLPLKNERIKSSSEVSKESETVHAEKVSVDECASLLAMMDERAYKRSLLCDSYVLAQRMIEPMALPWMHKGNPITRNTAFDIDDMTETLTADDGSYTPHTNGPLGFGKFDVGQMRRGPVNTRLSTSSTSICSASRRSDDPGLIEISSIVLPTISKNCAEIEIINESKNYHENEEGSRTRITHELPEGELALRYFEDCARQRQRRISNARRGTRIQTVSVKVGATSSRSSIFDGVEMGMDSCLNKSLDAILPAEVQNGKFLSAVKAQLIVKSLGAYDWRYGLSKSSTVGKSSRGLSCGRTRLIWTENTLDQPQKITYQSCLTGERLDQGSQKRPRHMKVIIRLGDSILGSISRSKPSKRDNDTPTPECTLDDEQFLSNIRKDSQRGRSERSKIIARLLVAAPVLDCLPDINGEIGVVCSWPGKISISSVHEFLNRASRKSNPVCCTVCWEPDLDRNNCVMECTTCGVQAHVQCCYQAGKIEALSADSGGAWKCAVCCYKSRDLCSTHQNGFDSSSEPAKKSRRKAKLPQWLQDSHIDETVPAGRPDHVDGEMVSHGVKCEICSFHGGCMSQVMEKDQPIWAHDVCRIWRKGRVRNQLSGFKLSDQCALCGKCDTRARPINYTIKCAASRCQVYFHPMCALLTARYHESQSETTDRGFHKYSQQGIDIGYCNTFSLSTLQCNVADEAAETRCRSNVDKMLPIGFCGVHNPKRESTSRGLYPAGRFLNRSAMKVPRLLGKEGTTDS